MKFKQLKPNIRFSSKDYQKYGNSVIFIKMGHDWLKRNSDSNAIDLLHDEEYRFGSNEKVEIVLLTKEERSQLEQLELIYDNEAYSIWNPNHGFIRCLLGNNEYNRYLFNPDEELIEKVNMILGFCYWI